MIVCTASLLHPNSHYASKIVPVVDPITIAILRYTLL